MTDPVNGFLEAHAYDPYAIALVMVGFCCFLAAMAFDLLHFPSRLK